MPRILLAVVVATLVAGACGDSGTDEQALESALKAEILERAAESGATPISDQEATCVAAGAVEELGADGLLGLGITTSGADSERPFAAATDEQVETITDVYLACLDIRQLMLNEISGDVSTESAECVADRVAAGDFLRPVIAGSLRGETVEFGDDPELSEAFVGIVVECLTAEELVDLSNQ